MHTTMDKIQITKSPALPSTCAVCHRSANGDVDFLDFQADLDYYGAIVICEDCWKNGMDALGFISIEERDTVLQNLEIALAELEAVREENERLQSAVDAIVRVRPDLASDEPTDLDDPGLDAPIEG